MTNEFDTRELQQHTLANLSKMRRELAARAAIWAFYWFAMGILASVVFHICK